MKIAIAGYGVEGEENYTYWAAQAQQGDSITIVDEHDQPSLPLPQGVSTILGAGAFEKLDDFDIVVRTAGLPPRKIKTSGKIWSATNEFFEKCPAPIIGVTGSKGKGTTASLVASVLKAAGIKTWLVGNIGTPALSVLNEVQPNDVVVYELSSFQLWDITRSPQTAVVLFIEQEHLDVHLNMEEYVAAKGNITRFQSSKDRLVYDADNQYSTLIAKTSSAYKIGYHEYGSIHSKVFDGIEGAYIEAAVFYYRAYDKTYSLCSTDALLLSGEHNKTNAIAALNAVWPYLYESVVRRQTELGESLEGSISHIIEAGLSGFKGLPHRLAYVETINGVQYYDDSIATTPGSAVAALKAFAGKEKVIILGGSYKGSDFTDIATTLAQPNYAAHVLLIGPEARRIADALDAAKVTTYEYIEAETGKAVLEKVVKRAYDLLPRGGVALLSPAAASFGLFVNYADRGEKYITAVKSLADQL